MKQCGAAVAPAAVTVRQAVRTASFWHLAIAVATSISANVMVMNLLSTIVKDRHFADHASVGRGCTVLTMSMDTLMRGGVGYTTFVHTGIPKQLFLKLGAGLAVLAQLAFAIDAPALVFVGCALAGVSDGVIWAVAPWLVGKLFGTANSAAIFGLVIFLTAIVTASLSFGLQPALYDSHIAAGATECSGIECFRSTHFSAAAVSVAGLWAAARLLDAHHQNARGDG